GGSSSTSSHRCSTSSRPPGWHRTATRSGRMPAGSSSGSTTWPPASASARPSTTPCRGGSRPSPSAPPRWPPACAGGWPRSRASPCGIGGPAWGRSPRSRWRGWSRPTWWPDCGPRARTCRPQRPPAASSTSATAAWPPWFGPASTTSPPRRSWTASSARWLPWSGREPTGRSALADPHLDRGGAQVERLPQPPLEVAQVGRGDLPVGEERERGRVGGGLGGVEHLHAVGAGLGLLSGPDDLVHPPGGDSAVVVLEAHRQRREQLVHALAGERAD